ncbi:uncharacterized protein LOC113311426 [Papaver somniferum]|uniref:uncharacterized protein LOC113311426 n=1 Tax=Papaver somniferum TaxID=3469 RepID=UPI000E704CA0|nr:uncharacterized protein LOC113311426 [Papaver somniferum]
MVGSSNGLVCYAKYNVDAIGAVPFLVCNPLTGESVFLPEYNYSELPQDTSSSKKRFAYGRLASGFGYCPSTKKYKVVTIYYHDGALYWLHQNSHKVQKCEIVAFDLEGEKFRRISLPRSEDFYYEYYGTGSPLQLLGGNNNLYLVHKFYTASRSDIWVYIKKDEKFQNKTFAITRNNEVLLWYKHGIDLGWSLYCYDPKTSTLNKLWDDTAKGMKCDHIEAIPHRQSIVSLKDLGETNVTFFKDLEELMLQDTSEHSGKMM